MSGSESSPAIRSQQRDGSFSDSLSTSVVRKQRQEGSFTESLSAASVSSRCLPEDERGLVISKRASIPFQPITHSSNDLSELTIDKLNFKKLHLHGRDKEINRLQECCGRVKSTTNCREFIVISGTSGTGKTSLAAAIKVDKDALHVQGKFDQRNNGIMPPYLGISRACAEILGKIVELLTKDREKYQAIRQAIMKELGSDIHLLIEFIPVLTEVVDIPQTGADDSDQALSADDSSNRITFAFLRFIRIISDSFQPLIMTIDDLQWADDASVNLLEALLVDDHINRVLLLGLYRSDEIDKEHFLHQFLNRLRDKKSSLEKTFQMQEVQLQNLEVEDIQNVLEELLIVDKDDLENDTLGLAQLCKDRTLGNPFFLTQYLRSLHSQNLLSYNFGSMKWTWNEETIRLQTDASQNAVALLLEKMNALSDDCIKLLQLAGLLGSTFSLNSIRALWNRMGEVGAEEKFLASLDTLEDSGLLLSFDDINCVSYSWVHDKIHEAAQKLTSDEERPGFARRAGEILLQTFDKRQTRSSIFVVVNLLNTGNTPSLSPSGRLSKIELAKWNCVAAKKAVGISAFESAAEYARIGIEFLPENAWSCSYQLAFDLYSLGAKAEGYLGNTAVMKARCNAVLEEKTVKEVDRLHLYNIMIDNMVLYDDVEEAVSIILGVMKRFRCDYPRNKFSIVCSILIGLNKAKATMQELDSAKIEVMHDPVREELTELTRRLNWCFYVLGDMRYPLTGFRAITWASSYGVCGASAIGFAQAGVVMIAVQQDYHGARQYADYAFKILDATHSDKSRSSVMMVASTFVYYWTQPINEILPFLLDSYNFGLRYGDTDNASVAILHYIILRFMDGAPLILLTNQLTQYTMQMKRFGKVVPFKLSRILLQAFLNLTGRDNVRNPTLLQGEALPEDGRKEADNAPMLWAACSTFGAIAKVILGDYVAVADEMVKHGADCVTKIFVASPTGVLDTHLKAVACYAAARETGKKKYANIAKKLHAKITKWSKAGNPNVKISCLFLEAESNALKGNRRKAITAYEQTIILSAKCGFQHDAALASERFGLYNAAVMGDTSEASYRLAKAREYWLNWGATAKVAHMDQKLKALLPIKPQSSLHISQGLGGSSSLLMTE